MIIGFCLGYSKYLIIKIYRMKILICDIDNTVADQMKSLKILNVSASPESYLEKSYSIDEMISYEVLDNALEGIKQFKSNHYKIIWLTARKNKFAKVTKDWLIQNKFPIDDLILVSKISKKIEVIDEIKPDLIIDDCNYNQHNLNPLPATDFISTVKKNHNLLVFKNNWKWIIENFEQITN